MNICLIFRGMSQKQLLLVAVAITCCVSVTHGWVIEPGELLRDVACKVDILHATHMFWFRHLD